MHRYNNKYGYGEVLRGFCGVGPNTPIWGELQHSLFLNTHYFSADGRLGPPREQLQRFPRLLSWQTLLPFPHQVPVGDPLLYSKVVNGSRTVLALNEKPGTGMALFMPKLNDELVAGNRFRHYKNGLWEAIERVGPLKVVIAPHPRELQYREEISREIGDVAEVMWAPVDYPGGAVAWSQQLIAEARTVVSDYFGAHVFRASVFHHTPAVFVGDELFNPGFHQVMKRITREFYDSSEDVHAQETIAKEVLGFGYQRTQEELSEILGFRGAKKLLGRPVRVIYQRVRRAKVSRRRRRIRG